MAIEPTLDIGDDWQFFHNVVDVTLILPDGRTLSTKALKEPTRTVRTETPDGARGFASYADWHLFRTALDGLVPMRNGYVVDERGNKWYIGRTLVQTFGTRYRVTTMLEGGATYNPKPYPAKALLTKGGPDEGSKGRFIWGGPGSYITWG